MKKFLFAAVFLAIVLAGLIIYYSLLSKNNQFSRNTANNERMGVLLIEEMLVDAKQGKNNTSSAIVIYPGSQLPPEYSKKTDMTPPWRSASLKTPDERASEEMKNNLSKALSVLDFSKDSADRYHFKNNKFPENFNSLDFILYEKKEELKEFDQDGFTFRVTPYGVSAKRIDSKYAYTVTYFNKDGEYPNRILCSGQNADGDKFCVVHNNILWDWASKADKLTWQ